MRAMHPSFPNRGGAPHKRTSQTPLVVIEPPAAEVPFDLDEEVEKRAELALARRHRFVTVAHDKPPRF